MGLLYKTASHLPPGVLRWAGRVQFRHPILRRLVSHASPAGAVTIRHGAAKGVKIHADDRSNVGYALGTTEPQVQDVLGESLNRRDVFYDVGGNVGFFPLIAAKLVGPEGRVVAIEPLPENADALRRNVALNGFENVEV